jgi:hypothetical protein
MKYEVDYTKFDGTVMRGNQVIRSEPVHKDLDLREPLLGKIDSVVQDIASWVGEESMTTCLGKVVDDRVHYDRTHREQQYYWPLLDTDKIYSC